MANVSLREQVRKWAQACESNDREVAVYCAVSRFGSMANAKRAARQITVAFAGLRKAEAQKVRRRIEEVSERPWEYPYENVRCSIMGMDKEEGFVVKFLPESIALSMYVVEGQDAQDMPVASVQPTIAPLTIPPALTLADLELMPMAAHVRRNGPGQPDSIGHTTRFDPNDIPMDVDPFSGMKAENDD